MASSPAGETASEEWWPEDSTGKKLKPCGDELQFANREIVRHCSQPPGHGGDHRDRHGISWRRAVPEPVPPAGAAELDYGEEGADAKYVDEVMRGLGLASASLVDSPHINCMKLANLLQAAYLEGSRRASAPEAAELPLCHVDTFCTHKRCWDAVKKAIRDRRKRFPAATIAPAAEESVYIVVRHGDWTEDMNGTPVTADRIKLYGAWSTRKEAERFLEALDSEHVPEWGVCIAWIEEVQLIARAERKEGEAKHA